VVPISEGWRALRPLVTQPPRASITSFECVGGAGISGSACTCSSSNDGIAGRPRLLTGHLRGVSSTNFGGSFANAPAGRWPAVTTSSRRCAARPASVARWGSKRADAERLEHGPLALNGDWDKLSWRTARSIVLDDT
jgi:hypothetical protein